MKQMTFRSERKNQMPSNAKRIAALGLLILVSGCAETPSERKMRWLYEDHENKLHREEVCEDHGLDRRGCMHDVGLDVGYQPIQPIDKTCQELTRAALAAGFSASAVMEAVKTNCGRYGHLRLQPEKKPLTEKQCRELMDAALKAGFSPASVLEATKQLRAEHVCP